MTGEKALRGPESPEAGERPAEGGAGAGLPGGRFPLSAMGSRLEGGRPMV